MKRVYGILLCILSGFLVTFAFSPIIISSNIGDAPQLILFLLGAVTCYLIISSFYPILIGKEKPSTFTSNLHNLLGGFFLLVIIIPLVGLFLWALANAKTWTDFVEIGIVFFGLGLLVFLINYSLKKS